MCKCGRQSGEVCPSCNNSRPGVPTLGSVLPANGKTPCCRPKPNCCMVRKPSPERPCHSPEPEEEKKITIVNNISNLNNNTKKESELDKRIMCLIDKLINECDDSCKCDKCCPGDRCGHCRCGERRDEDCDCGCHGGHDGHHHHDSDDERDQSSDEE